MREVGRKCDNYEGRVKDNTRLIGQQTRDRGDSSPLGCPFLPPLGLPVCVLFIRSGCSTMRWGKKVMFYYSLVNSVLSSNNYRQYLAPRRVLHLRRRKLRKFSERTVGLITHPTHKPPSSLKDKNLQPSRSAHVLAQLLSEDCRKLKT